MNSCQFDSALDTDEQHYHRRYEHVPDCIALTDLIISPATILEANRHAGTSSPTRIIATLHPTSGDLIPVMVEGITIEQPRASEAESINTRCLRLVHEIRSSEACHAGY